MPTGDHTAQKGAWRPRQRGFTYLAVLGLMAVTAYTTATLLKQGMTLQRRDAERELLAVGLRWTQALESYAATTPAGMDHRPTKLEDLVRDPRFPGQVIRHLRRIEPDPVAGQRLWGEVRTPDGKHITGIYSLAPGRPYLQLLKAPFQDFSEAQRYGDWVFKAGLGED